MQPKISADLIIAPTFCGSLILSRTMITSLSLFDIKISSNSLNFKGSTSKANPWCTELSLKNLLNSLDLTYIEKDLSDDDERQKFYKKVGNGVSTVPQIYIQEKRIGGFPELVAWFEENGY